MCFISTVQNSLPFVAMIIMTAILAAHTLQRGILVRANISCCDLLDTSNLYNVYLFNDIVVKAEMRFYNC